MAWLAWHFGVTVATLGVLVESVPPPRATSLRKEAELSWSILSFLGLEFRVGVVVLLWSLDSAHALACWLRIFGAKPVVCRFIDLGSKGRERKPEDRPLHCVKPSAEGVADSLPPSTDTVSVLSCLFNLQSESLAHSFRCPSRSRGNLEYRVAGCCENTPSFAYSRFCIVNYYLGWSNCSI